MHIEARDPTDSEARYCLSEYFAELDRRFDSGFDPAASLPADADEMRPPLGVLLIAIFKDEPVGCGALKFHNDAPTELKRMWVAPHTRGLGIGRQLLAELERRAAREGSRSIRLETNRTLTEAITMYRSAGYEEVRSFNDERYADHWFEKSLERPSLDSDRVDQTVDDPRP